MSLSKNLANLFIALTKGEYETKTLSTSTVEKLETMLGTLVGQKMSDFARDLTTILKTTKTEQEVMDKANELYARIQQ